MNNLIFERTIGQKNIKDRFNLSFIGNKFPQSLILYGKLGMGQYAIACDLIENMIESWENHIICFPSSDKTTVPSENEQFEKYQELLKNPYQDPHQNKDFISINQIREIEKKVLYKSINQRKRFISLWGIEFLTLSATNALLKLLEEPPKHTYFILVSNQIEKILPTIRSRCIEFFFPNLSQDDFTTLEQFQDKKTKKTLTLSGFSVTQFYKIQALEEDQLISQSFNLFKLISQQNWMLFCETIEKKELWNDSDKIKLILTISLEILFLCLKNQTQYFPNSFEFHFTQKNSISIRQFLENNLIRIQENSKPSVTLNGLFLALLQQLRMN